MNVAVLKTKAEQALSEGYAGVADALPGDFAVAGGGKQVVRRAVCKELLHRKSRLVSGSVHQDPHVEGAARPEPRLAQLRQERLGQRAHQEVVQEPAA